MGWKDKLKDLSAQAQALGNKALEEGKALGTEALEKTKSATELGILGGAFYSALDKIAVADNTVKPNLLLLHMELLTKPEYSSLYKQFEIAVAATKTPQTPTAPRSAEAVDVISAKATDLGKGAKEAGDKFTLQTKLTKIAVENATPPYSKYTI